MGQGHGARSLRPEPCPSLNTDERLSELAAGCLWQARFFLGFVRLHYEYGEAFVIE